MSKIGIALGCGGARGWAHIGVIKALQDMGIQPDVIAGCSIGAVVGAAYAMGRLDELHDWVLKLKRSQVLRLFDLSLFRGGFIKGYRVLDVLWGNDAQVNIEELPMPFAAVATDIDNGHEVWLTKGDLLTAVRASFSLPGFFNPVNINNRWLVDGGITNPIPVSICRVMGAEKIIAVNLNKDILGRHRIKKETSSTSSKLFNRLYEKSVALWPFGNKNSDAAVPSIAAAPGYFDILASSLNIMQYRITNSRLAGDAPDVIIEPLLARMETFDFDRAEEAIEEGYASVTRVRSNIDFIFS